MFGGGVTSFTLSETIIALASDENYVSSQDGSEYIVKKHNHYSGDDKIALTAEEYSSASVISDMDDSIECDNTGCTIPYAGTATLTMTVPETAYYYMEFMVVDIAMGDAPLTVYVNDTMYQAIAAEGDVSYSYTDFDMVQLNEGDVIRTNFYAETELTFGLQKIKKFDSDVRYEGLDPDNYLTFNGEEAGWRIIGVFEGSTIGLEPGKQYTKIIRNTRIGLYAWDSDTTDSSYENDWTNSTLNTYLNGTYLSSMTDANKIAKYNGSYSTWYLRGPSNYYNLYSQDWYVTERVSGQAGYRNGTQYGADTETTGAIGIMYPSDYGYAAYGSSCDNNSSIPLDSYGGECAAVDWLATDSINNGDWELLLSPHPDSSDLAFYVDGGSGGCVYYDIVGYELAVRPVLYLEASETLSGGSGTKLDPYVIK